MRISDFRMTRKGRVAVYVDGDFLLAMHPDVFAASGLSVGSEVDAEQLEALTAEAELKKAKEKALSLLSYQPYTKHQLREKLERQVGEEAAEEAIARMEELGLVDDDDYAQRFAKELSQRKGYGILRIRQEMRKKGLTSEQIEFATSMLEEDPKTQMREILEKKYPLAAESEPVRRRAFGALVRMGYRSGDARRVLNDFCNGIDNEDF